MHVYMGVWRLSKWIDAIIVKGVQADVISNRKHFDSETCSIVFNYHSIKRFRDIFS